jgi:folate-dependent phosphoribosylglycinamide formyltransferase PurN
MPRPCAGVARISARGVRAEVVPWTDAGDWAARVWPLVEAAGADLVCNCGFLRLLPIPPRWENRVLNIHPGLLPAFGGKGMYGDRVHAAVLASGARESGCTVHFANNEYDRGPIILQKRVPVREGDTVQTLAARVFEVECEAYPEAIRLFGEGRLLVEEGKVSIR